MSDAVARLNAALEGRYVIERELGEGGMATVYVADDLKHNRKVALKVLKPELAAVVGAERFLAEIETTANLTHPHILPLFDSGEADSFLFYVMPYLEGETLRDRIDREKQLPVDEAVRIATAVANALDHAHRHKVIHRDIKPANILLQDGEPVVSDFGIALALGVAGGTRLTETGLSVGTPYYMSPEQATGDQTVGASTDTYALGSVLYEMLVGDPPFAGSTAQAVLRKIIAGKSVSAREERPSIPANVDAALRKALEKLPADRFASAQEFAKALDDPGFRYQDDLVIAGGEGKRGFRLVAALGVAFLAGAAGSAVWLSSSNAGPRADMVRFTIEPGGSTALQVGGSRPDLAISPDGGRIVYRGANADGSLPQLNLRSIDQLVETTLSGSEGGLNPFFSPDGQWVGFVSVPGGNSLHRISILGGAPVMVAEVNGFIEGASWGEDDQIIFGVGGSQGGLFRVPAGGGDPEQLTSLDSGEGETFHLWPSIIDGREAVLFTIFFGGNIEGVQIAALDLRNGEVKRLGLGGTGPRYVESGHVVYAAQDGSIRAVPFDPTFRWR